MIIICIYIYIYIHIHTVYTHFAAGCRLFTWPIQSPGSSSGKLTGWWHHSSRICSEASVQLPCLPPDFMQLQRESVESNGLKVFEWEAPAIFTSGSVQWQGTWQFDGMFDSTARHDVHSLAWSMGRGRGITRNSKVLPFLTFLALLAQRPFESSWNISSPEQWSFPLQSGWNPARRTAMGSRCCKWRHCSVPFPVDNLRWFEVLYNVQEKASLVARLLAAKEQSGKTFDERLVSRSSEAAKQRFQILFTASRKTTKPFLPFDSDCPCHDVDVLLWK